MFDSVSTSGSRKCADYLEVFDPAGVVSTVTGTSASAHFTYFSLSAVGHTWLYSAGVKLMIHGLYKGSILL